MSARLVTQPPSSLGPRASREGFGALASFALYLLCLGLLLCAGCTRTSSPDAPSAGEDWVDVAITLDQDLVDETDGDAIAMIEVSASGAPSGSVPARVALVIDTSGSMEGQKMEEARMAARGLVDGLNDGDELTIVGYSDAAVVHLDRWRARPDRSAAHAAIDAIEADGNTCLSCGLQSAYDVFAARASEGVTRVVVLSDGHANRGLTDPASLEHLVAGAYDAHRIDTATIGLGRLHDEVRLGRLADAGRADYYFLANASELDALLARELEDLHRTSVTNVVVRVQPGDGVGFGAVHHTNARWSDEGLLLPVGQLAVGETRQFLVPLALPAGNMGRTLRVQADFSGVEGGAYRVEQDAYVHRTREVTAIDASRHPKVGAAYALLVAAAQTEVALDLYAEGDQAGATALLDANEALLHQAAGAYDDAALRDEAAVTSELREVLSAAPLQMPGRPAEVEPESAESIANRSRARGNAMNQRARARERQRGQAASAPSWHEPAIEPYDDLQ